MAAMSFWDRLSPRGATMVEPTAALPGRARPAFDLPPTNEVLGTPLLGPWPAGTEVMYLAMGCFWGAEKKFWHVPGVVGTAVGYMGGFTPNPTYDEVCSGRTGHAEVVLVAYDPQRVGAYDVLKTFWENHDPTQGYRQGNDVGSQYRSAAYWTDAESERLVRATAAAYGQVLAEQGIGRITTELAPADGLTFYPAEGYHQQYLHKVPHGYDCHANTGISLPAQESLAL
jgi:peptide-methionine (S)-S-oxide reductase